MPRHFTPLSLQRGAAAMVAAVWLVVAVACLMVLDLANIFWQKREVQKIADFAASAGASTDLQAGLCPLQAKSSATQNGWREGVDTLTVMPVQWMPNLAFSEYKNKGADNNACAVEVTRPVPYLFVWSGRSGAMRTVTADAIAIQQSKPLARLFIRTTLVNVNSDNGALLNAVVGGLLGGSLNLNAVSWQGLAQTDIRLLDFLDALKIKAGLKALSYEQLLKTQVDINHVLQAIIAVLPNTGGIAGQLGGFAPKAGSSTLKIKIADLLSIQGGDLQAALTARLNAFQLLQGAAQVASQNAGAAVELNILGIAGLKLKIIEPPQWSIGAPKGLTARTAQIELDANLLLVKLHLAVGGAEAKVTDYSCASSTSKSLTVDVTQRAAEFQLEVDVSSKSSSLPLLNVPLKLLEQKRHNLLLYAPTKPVIRRIEDPPPSDMNDADWERAAFQNNLLQRLVDDVENMLLDTVKSLPLVGGLLGFVLQPVLDLVLSIVSNTVLKLLDAIVNELLRALGINLAQAEVAGQLSCGYGAELVH